MLIHSDRWTSVWRAWFVSGGYQAVWQAAGDEDAAEPGGTATSGQFNIPLLFNSRTLACLVLDLRLVRSLAHLLVLHHRPVRSRTRWSLRGPPPGSWDRCRSLQGTSRSHLRSGDRCGGRLRPGWPSPGGRHKRRSSPDLLHSCAVGKRRPEADQRGQILNYLHAVLDRVLEF